MMVVPAGTPVPVTTDGTQIFPVTALIVSVVVPVDVPVPVAGGGAAKTSGSLISTALRGRPASRCQPSGSPSQTATGTVETEMSAFGRYRADQASASQEWCSGTEMQAAAPCCTGYW